MDVDALNINAQVAVEENVIKTEIETISTEKEAVVHKLKKALAFLENVNVQNEESLKLANIHAPLDELLSSLSYFPVKDGRCFNDLPTELKANILSKSYLCDPCAYVAASVCHEWKDIIEKRLKEALPWGASSVGTVCITDDPDNCYCSQRQVSYDTSSEDILNTSTEDMLNAALIHKMKIKLNLAWGVRNVDSKLLAEALTTISDFDIYNNFMCFVCNENDTVMLSKTQLEHLFNAMEKKTEIDRVRFGGLSTAHLDQGKVIDCLFKIKDLTLADASVHSDQWCEMRKDGDLVPSGPVVDMELFVEKLLHASSGMKLSDLSLGYFQSIPKNLSVHLANGLCKVKSVSLLERFPLEDATIEQLIKNIRGGGIVMNSLTIWKVVQWNMVVSVEDLKMAMMNMKHLRLRGDFTVEQLEMVRPLSGVEIIEGYYYKKTGAGVRWWGAPPEVEKVSFFKIIKG